MSLWKKSDFLLDSTPQKSRGTHETTSSTLCRERPIRARCSMTCALTTLRGADNPHTGRFTSSRPAFAALYESLAKKEFHPASWTGPAKIPRESSFDVEVFHRDQTIVFH